jgi:Increased loss of mitochondrial DNA protein 1
VTGFDKASPATAFLAIMFAFLGLSDLTAVSMTDHVAYHYWRSQTPVRLLFLFGLTTYTYISKPTTAFGFSTSKFYGNNPTDTIKNGFIFTWAFIESAIWFLVYLSLRDERQRISAKRV